MTCPVCGAPAVDVTTHGDPVPRWICIDNPAHDAERLRGHKCPPQKRSLLKKILARLFK